MNAESAGAYVRRRLSKGHLIMAIQSRVLWVAAALCAGIATGLQATEATAVPSVYMGGPVELVKAPNGAITNRKLLDRVGAFNWLEPTIENPAPGI